MTVLEFIFGILVLMVILIIVVAIYGMKTNYIGLEQENEKLKEDLKKARSKKSKDEYEKDREVK